MRSDLGPDRNTVLGAGVCSIQRTHPSRGLWAGDPQYVSQNQITPSERPSRTDVLVSVNSAGRILEG
jgi:hypothetical protein